MPASPPRSRRRPSFNFFEFPRSFPTRDGLVLLREGSRISRGATARKTPARKRPPPKDTDFPSQPETPTRWYHLVSYFFGGAFLTNTIPHFVAGVSGSPFQSPFASPPGEGLSSALVNVLWGLFNLAVGYLLVIRVGRFDLRRTPHVLALGAGVAFTAVLLAWSFAKFHGGNI